MCILLSPLSLSKLGYHGHGIVDPQPYVKDIFSVHTQHSRQTFPLISSLTQSRSISCLYGIPVIRDAHVFAGEASEVYQEVDGGLMPQYPC